MSKELSYFLWGCWSQNLTQEEALQKAAVHFKKDIAPDHVAYVYAACEEEYEEYKRSEYD